MANSYETTNVKFVLRSFATKGKGKAWVAECFKPWTPGDPSCVKYLNPNYDEFTLKTGGIYKVHEPMEVEVEDEDEETQITSRDYYVMVRENEEVEEISDAKAQFLLSKLANNKHLRPSSSIVAPVKLTAMLQGEKLTLTSECGKVSFVLPPTVLRKLVGGRDGGQ